MTTPEETGKDFSQRLDNLFKNLTHPDGREFSYEEVQNGTGKAVTAAYIWRLRTGKAKNPGFGVIKALSNFFGVDPNYFFVEEGRAAETVNRQDNSILAARFEDSSVKAVALRASEMDEKGRQAILSMMDYILHKKDE